ncbi:MAG: UPF0147 family protein [Euryarchaeota archaeon]|nr:UPF0147 family protein [Euryarchaeota archaeon]
MEQEEKMRQICEVLDQVIEDTSIPRNIRRAAEEAKNALMNEKEDIGVRVSSAIYILEEISNDRNLPLHARTIIWNVSSELETIKT